MTDPTPDEAIDRIRTAFGPRPGDRTLHAKGAFFSGSFRATAEAAARCRAIPFRGEEVPVLVRWSNGAGKRRSDAVPDVRGMAVSFRPSTGDAMDLLGQTAPRFPVRTPAAFLDFTEAAVKPWKVGLFLAQHPRSIPAMLANARAKAILPPRSYAEIPYYPIHAYGWTSAAGDHCWVRFVLRPQRSDRPEGSFTGPNRLHEELVARLAAGPVRRGVRPDPCRGRDRPARRPDPALPPGGLLGVGRPSDLRLRLNDASRTRLTCAGTISSLWCPMRCRLSGLGAAPTDRPPGGSSASP